MSLITSLTALAASELRAALRNNLRLVAVYGAAGLAVLAAIGFALAALHRVLEQSYGPLWADLIIAGGLLVVAALLIGLAQYLAHRARRRANLARAAAVAPIAASLLLKKPRLSLAAIAAALIVGGLAGRSFKK